MASSLIQAVGSSSVIDTRGLPSHECVNCGSNMFLIVASFEDYEISMWGLDAHCANCDAPVTVPCPVDRPHTLDG